MSRTPASRSSSDGRSSLADVRLVASREVGEKLHSRAFVLSTLLFLVLVAASVALPALLFDDGPEEYDVAVVGAPPPHWSSRCRTSGST